MSEFFVCYMSQSFFILLLYHKAMKHSFKKIKFNQNYAFFKKKSLLAKFF